MKGMQDSCSPSGVIGRLLWAGINLREHDFLRDAMPRGLSNKGPLREGEVADLLMNGIVNG